MTKIIAFAGRKQSGKTTSANFVCRVFSETTQQVSSVYNFADPLKLMCIDILGLEYDQCYGTDEQKNEIVNCYWEGNQLTAREVLQIVGTDMFRTMQHNVWADATIRKIKNEGLPLAVIADCRFPNEVDAVKKAGGIVVKLTRDVYHSSHASETALDPSNYPQELFDYVIPNHILDVTRTNKIIFDLLQNYKIV